MTGQEIYVQENATKRDGWNGQLLIFAHELTHVRVAPEVLPV